MSETTTQPRLVSSQRGFFICALYLLAMPPLAGGIYLGWPHPEFRMPLIQFVQAGQQVSEDARLVFVDLSIQPFSPNRLQVPIEFSGTATGDGVDYLAKEPFFEVEPGKDTARLKIEIRDDGLKEGDETINLRLKPCDHYLLRTLCEHTIVVRDPPPVELALSGKPLRIPESGGPVTVTVTASRAVDFPIQVPLAFRGSARRGADYTVSEAGFVIPPGGRSTQIIVTPIDDTLYEDDETIDLAIEPHTDQIIAAKAAKTSITIVDNDPPPTVKLFAPQTVFPENGSTPVRVQVLLSKVCGKAINVPLEVPDGSPATATYADHKARPTVIQIPEGKTSAEYSFDIIDDQIPEPHETIIIRLKEDVPVQNPSDRMVAITIKDDDLAVSISADRISVNEGDGSEITLTVQSSSEPEHDLSIPFRVSASATPGVDHDLTDGVSVIPAGHREAMRRFHVLDDSLSEDEETIRVALVPPSGIRLAGTGAVEIKIVDNDPLPLIALQPASQTVRENAPEELALYVRFLNGKPSGRDVTVEFDVAGSTTEARDYLVRSRQVTIPAGQVQAKIPITVLDDTEVEDLLEPEIIRVSLVRATKAKISPDAAQATIAIEDDEPHPGNALLVLLLTDDLKRDYPATRDELTRLVRDQGVENNLLGGGIFLLGPQGFRRWSPDLNLDGLSAFSAHQAVAALNSAIRLSEKLVRGAQTAKFQLIVLWKSAVFWSAGELINQLPALQRLIWFGTKIVDPDERLGRTFTVSTLDDAVDRGLEVAVRFLLTHPPE